MGVAGRSVGGVLCCFPAEDSGRRGSVGTGRACAVSRKGRGAWEVWSREAAAGIAPSLCQHVVYVAVGSSVGTRYFPRPTVCSGEVVRLPRELVVRPDVNPFQMSAGHPSVGQLRTNDTQLQDPRMSTLSLVYSTKKHSLARIVRLMRARGQDGMASLGTHGITRETASGGRGPLI